MRTRIVHLLIDGRKLSEYATIHEALGANRVAPQGSKIIANNDVLAQGMATKWELRAAGISALLEEFHSPLFAKARG